MKSVEEWVAIPGSLEAIKIMNHLGYWVGVATNQSGIARGYYTLNTLADIHQSMNRQLAYIGAWVDNIVWCPHHPSDDCSCRKPKPGMLVDLAACWGIKPSEMMFVGDSFRDLQAAMTVGAEPVLVKTGNGCKTLEKHKDALKDMRVVNDLLSLANELKDNMAMGGLEPPTSAL